MNPINSFLNELEKAAKKGEAQKLITNTRIMKSFKPRLKAGTGPHYIKNLLKRLTKVKLK